MEKLGLNEIREKFLSFYESKGHLRLPSFSLIPQNDNSLLLINAGMAPLKAFFTGKETPPCKRVTTCQKCIRTPDIERVGKTARHGTYFEMLGNFSFGDYFKHEATAWAWEFATQVLGLPADKLWVSIYEEDDEAFDIWTKEVGVAPDHIVRMGKEDNFWEIGTGPCGPCSELYFDRGAEAGCGKPDCHVGCECDRFVEFWNLVFTQFDKDEEGNYHPLEHPNIDTGMGLERIACIMQGVDNLFEVDTVRRIMDKVCEIAHVTYGQSKQTDVSLRVITDHIRSTTFMIADGVQVSNEGRGYVLRRLLRRAARHGKLLGVSDPFLYKIVDTVIAENHTAYPELGDKADYIKKIVELEEQRFAVTIDGGLSILNGYIGTLKEEGKTQLSGQDAFRLYDTYGFPIDLTLEILEEQGMTADQEGFDACMEEQRRRARESRTNADAGWKDDELRKLYSLFETVFVGYDTLQTEARVVGIVRDLELQESSCAEDGNLMLILDKTPFYGESGGQVGDTGRITANGLEVEVLDCRKMGNGKLLHMCNVLSGRVAVGDTVVCTVDKEARRATERNHSATHLLQKALRTVLGSHVEQAGSYVSSERLRFDFSHYAAVTPEQIAQVEDIVNHAIADALPVICEEMPIADAKKLGAMALFGEKYGDIVRVVRMGDFSTELCGGTHVKNTAQVGLFKIVSEAGIAAGVRRIEAITSRNILKCLAEAEAVIAQSAGALKAAPHEMAARIAALQAQVKSLEKEIAGYKEKAAAGGLDDIKRKAEEIGGVTILRGAFVDADPATLRKMADGIRDEFDCVVTVLAAYNEEKVTLLTSANKAAVDKGVHCGNLVREIAKLVGGSGGGRPDSAQAGGKNPKGVDEALLAASEVLQKQVGEA